MIRIVLAISLIGLTLSCSHQDPRKTVMKSAGKNTNPDDRTQKNFAPSADSSFYVGYVDYFPETKEFYTDLFYQNEDEYPDEDLLEAKLDSVIALGDDWGRERLPMEEARKMLVMSGLDTLLIYNRKHQLICTAPLARVEYLWNGLESYFIGVFKSDGKLMQQTGELYGVSSIYSRFRHPSFAAEEIEDKVLNRRLVEKLHLDPTLNWDMRHFLMTPQKSIYSVISCYVMASNEGQSYLTSFENNNVTILNHEVNNYHFLNILPLPMEVNGKPLLLICAGYPSSDVLWDYLAGFDGKSYEAIDYNRPDARLMLVKR